MRSSKRARVTSTASAISALPSTPCLTQTAVRVLRCLWEFFHLPGAACAKRLTTLGILAALFGITGDSSLQLAAGIGAAICSHTLLGHPCSLLGRSEVSRFDRSLNRGLLLSRHGRVSQTIRW